MGCLANFSLSLQTNAWICNINRKGIYWSANIILTSLSRSIHDVSLMWYESLVCYHPIHGFNVIMYYSKYPLLFQMHTDIEAHQLYDDIVRRGPRIKRCISFGDGIPDLVDDLSSAAITDTTDRQHGCGSNTTPRGEPGRYPQRETPRSPYSQWDPARINSDTEQRPLSPLFQSNISCRLPGVDKCMYKGCDGRVMSAWSDFCNHHTQHITTMLQPFFFAAETGNSPYSNDESIEINKVSIQNQHGSEPFAMPTLRGNAAIPSAIEACCANCPDTLMASNQRINSGVTQRNNFPPRRYCLSVGSSTTSKNQNNAPVKSTISVQQPQELGFSTVQAPLMPEPRHSVPELSEDMLRDYELMVGNIIEASKHAYKKCRTIGCLNYGNPKVDWFCNQCIKKYFNGSYLA